MQSLRVTAPNGLNIRRQPSVDAEVIAVMPQGMIVLQTDSAAWNGGWVRVRAAFSETYAVEGYSLGTHLASEGLESAPSAADQASAPNLRHALYPMTRDNELRRHMDELHAQFRPRVEQLLERCTGSGLRFKVLEAFRTPSRQRRLFLERRNGKRVTDADTWQSNHNYGLAADLVLDIPGIGPWEDGKIGSVDYGKMWLKMRELAHKSGLRTLTKNGKPWDFPHVELPECSWRKFQQGAFPGGGGQLWALNLQRMAASFPQGAPNLDSLGPELSNRHSVDAIADHADDSAHAPPAHAKPVPAWPPSIAEPVHTRS